MGLDGGTDDGNESENEGSDGDDDDGSQSPWIPWEPQYLPECIQLAYLKTEQIAVQANEILATCPKPCHMLLLNMRPLTSQKRYRPQTPVLTLDGMTVHHTPYNRWLQTTV